MSDVILLVLGAALGYGAGWLQQTLDRVRRRRSVATALAAEFVRLEQTIQYVRSTWRGGEAVVAFPSPMFDRVPELVDLFRPLTVARLMDFVGHQAELRRQLAYYAQADDPAQRKRLIGEIKEFAQDVASKGSLARESLHSEGADHTIGVAPLTQLVT